MRRLLRWILGGEPKPAPPAPQQTEPTESPAEPVQREYLAAASANPKSIQVALTALAAVGASVITGISLSDLSNASDSGRRTALVAATVAMSAVLVAIFVSYLAQTKSEFGFLETSKKRSVRRYLRRNQTVLSGLYKDVDALRADYVLELEAFAQAWHAKRSNFEDQAVATAYDTADRRLGLLDEQVTTVISSISFFLTKRRARRLGYVMFGSALVAIGALVVFIDKTHPPSTEEVVLEPAPVNVTLSLTPAGQEVLRLQAGENCGDTMFAALALSNSKDGGVNVVTVGSPGCSPARLTVTPTLGHVEPSD